MPDCLVSCDEAKKIWIPASVKIVAPNVFSGFETDVTIYCEKASHKGIIIGKQGAMLKKISSMARTDCEKFMGTKVYLTTWVKVKENWRDSDFLVRNFGYRE